ncbi:unnamed protein product [Camellia sinensis]|uniref:EF-hand domain-containing protein n=1 Tax=Camellia sinensis var. sinensis TaxID=542762 RepID=A0A4S4DRU9_CAMSN|nr:uncharacterized protein LOC114288529 [Camellia sinensis]THG05892.1 hypothetical protein TEA_023517 [Camellia sinensis var. sinensis]
MEGHHHRIGMLEIAEIYFNTSSENLKQLIEDFFNSMDEDHDKKVSLSEFLNNMKEEGLVKAENPPEMFKALDVNHDGSLDFKEVMALYYVIKSGRPFCGGCGKFIPGMFFSCSICFDNEDDKFCVCPKCFSNENKSYTHKHMPGHFLDNFALLEAKRKMAMDTRKPPPSPEEPKKKSTWLLRLLESAIGAAAVAGAEVAAVSGAAAAADLAAEGDSCSIM